MPDLTALDLLLAVAHSGSLNAAARQVGVSQQAISARMRALEAQIGVSLLARTTKGSTLTPQGAVIADWAYRVLDAAHELDVGLAALRADRRGEPVSVGDSPEIAIDPIRAAGEGVRGRVAVAVSCVGT